MAAPLTALVARLRAALESPRAVAWAVGLVALLSVPVLFQGLQADDHALRGLVLGAPPWDRWAKSPLELFSFYNGDPARTTSLVDHGFSPWWTDPDLRIMFFRPLSALTHRVDFQLWPGTPALMHLQSVVWYLSLCAGVGALYRRVLGAGWVAALAAFFYAIDPTHGVLIAWLANRNAVVGATFAVAALLLHDRATRERRPILSLASAGCLALGLLGGEVALGVTCYLAAYAAFLDDRPLRARLGGLAPHLVVLGAWAAVYRAGGYGARFSGIYVDPGQSPGAFLGAVVRHVPLLLQAELGGLGPDALIFLPGAVPFALVAAAALVIVALIAFFPLRGDARARFFFAGALASTVLVCSVFPAGRLMLLPGIGVLGLLALVVEGVVDRTVAWRPGAARGAAVFVAVWVGGGHLFLAPLLLQVATHQLVMMERIIARYGDALGEDPVLGRQRVVIANAPDVFFAYSMTTQRMTAGRPAPESLLVLAPGTRGVELDRRDARTLLVRSDGGFYRAGTEVLTRSLERPIPVGTRFPFTGVSVEVTAADASGVPTEALFRFDVPLEDPSLRWVEWRGATLVPFALPAVGERRRIEGQRLAL